MLKLIGLQVTLKDCTWDGAFKYLCRTNQNLTNGLAQDISEFVYNIS